jgi:DNA helicase HerA-like ATPase
VLAEGFSDIGVPVFLADVKGDLSGLARPGSPTRRSTSASAASASTTTAAAYPVAFWDLFGKKGTPVAPR